MDYLDGHVVTRELPPPLDDEEARRRSPTTSSTRSPRSTPPTSRRRPVAAFARPGSYPERQVRRFTELWEINPTRELPESTRSGAARPAPAGPLPPTVVHGDYRLGNMIVAAPTRPGSPRSRLGDGRDRRPARRRRLPARNVLRARAATRTRSARSPVTASRASRRAPSSSSATRAERPRRRPLAWFEALALWKAAVFCEAIYGRYIRGELAADDDAREPLRAGRAETRGRRRGRRRDRLSRAERPEECRHTTTDACEDAV